MTIETENMTQNELGLREASKLEGEFRRLRPWAFTGKESSLFTLQVH